MIEASDSIKHLITHRAEVFASLDKYHTVFDADALFHIANAGLACAATAPSFLLIEPSVRTAFQYSDEISGGKFAVPFPAYSVVIDRAADVVFCVVQNVARGTTFIQFHRGPRGWRLGIPITATIEESGLIHHWVTAVRDGVTDAELERYADEHMQIVGENQTDDAPLLRQYGNGQTNFFFDTLHAINHKDTLIKFRPAAAQPMTVMQASKKLLPFWEYKVVEINKVRELPAPPKGGTHATPRWHQVRGFWRTSKNGVKHFVKSFSRGDKTKGIIEHDYAVMV